MRLLQHIIPENCDIVPHGDNHEGNPECDRDGLLELIDWIGAKPRRYFIQMGDAIEATTVDHKYYEYANDETPIPHYQRDAVVEMYKPIKRRGIAWLQGNHENRWRNTHRYGEDMAKQLGIKFGGQQCKIHLRIANGDTVCKIHAAHPDRVTLSSTCEDEDKRIASLKGQIKKRMWRKASDCLVHMVGHVHKNLIRPPVQPLSLYDDGERLHAGRPGQADPTAQYIDPDLRWYVATGSFLRSQMIDSDPYSERYFYDPIEMGYPIMHIRKGRLSDITRVVI